MTELVLSVETPDVSAETGYYAVVFDTATSTQEAVEKLSHPPQEILDILLREDDYSEDSTQIRKIITARIESVRGTCVAAYVLKHSTLHALQESDIRFPESLLRRFNQWRAGLLESITSRPSSWWSSQTNPMFVYYLWYLSNKNSREDSTEFILRLCLNIVEALMKYHFIVKADINPVVEWVEIESKYYLAHGVWRTPPDRLGDAIQRLTTEVDEESKDYIFLQSLYVLLRNPIKSNDVYGLMMYVKHLAPENAPTICAAIRESIPLNEVLLRVNAY